MKLLLLVRTLAPLLLSDHTARAWSIHRNPCRNNGSVSSKSAGPEPHSTSSHDNRRRQFLSSWVDRAGKVMALTTALPSGGGWGYRPPACHAVITDETDAYANSNVWTPGSGPTTTTSSSSPPPLTHTDRTAANVSDEVTVQFQRSELLAAGGLGLELSDIEFRTNRRVFVKSVRPGSLADRLGVQTDWIVVSLNGASTERTNAQGVSRMLQAVLQQANNDDKNTKAAAAANRITLVFRDPRAFRAQLENLGSSSSSPQSGTATTQVAPAGDTSQRRATDGSLRPGKTETRQDDQRITVQELIAPRLCNRGATTGDLLEISYLGTVAETGQVFDGSAIKVNGQAIPGRGDDVTLFFVLGKQPFGQFPPGWDTGLYGMCVGERRRVLVPPVLAYGATGMPRRGIPPDATLQYDITLVSINGLATPQ